MEITFFGMNCVRITSKDVALLCNPYPKSSGLGDLKLANDATLLGTPGDELPLKPGMVIDGPGEYEIKGAMVTGVPARLHIDEENAPMAATIFSVQIGGIRLVALGNIAPGLASPQIEALGQVDVLVVPIGGHGLTLDSIAATELISQLEPKYVIPTHYDDGVAKYDVPQDKLEAFMKEVGANPEAQPKLRVSPKDLPLETTVVVLSRPGSV